MLGAANSKELLEAMMQADEHGVRLETIGNLPVWELFPSPLHQGVVRAIDRSVRPADGQTESDGGSYTLSDAYLRLPDGSLRRPDLMIYCSEPTLTREALTVVPEAVVEVVSPGSEFKDLQISPPSYLANGVKDVLVVDPETSQATWFRRDGSRVLRRGETVTLECGCQVTL